MELYFDIAAPPPDVVVFVKHVANDARKYGVEDPLEEFDEAEEIILERSLKSM